MEPISNVDRLVLLLRQRLQDRDRLRAGDTAAGHRTAKKSDANGLSAAQALAAAESIDERQLRRALIQDLLSDQFGERMLNEPRFQQVVDRVTTAIEADESGLALLRRISGELRAR
jgi:hypothetical protein